MAGIPIERFPIHLGLSASAGQEPEFTGDLSWYEAYGVRHAADGAEGRLVTVHSFSGDWNMWEMHPHGDEVVLCLEGEMALHQERPDGTGGTATIAAGEYVINPAGTWHTADIASHAKALFITAGEGTRHRPR
ncbi:cupin domain-containing protein [Tsuneonella suprasediminis]|uniref:cupin domain-containing protein n=1 Tax=Tsuneonella suprasediminis TaxID=2306996 RepID=UPI002F93DB46